jgi:hypothetical protein
MPGGLALRDESYRGKRVLAAHWAPEFAQTAYCLKAVTSERQDGRLQPLRPVPPFSPPR